MDFSFTEEQEDLRGLARRILQDQVTAERLKELEAGTERVDREVWAEFAKAGLVGIALPERVGGGGYGIMELAVILAEVGRRVAPIPLLATGATAIAIAEAGTEAQQDALLPGVIDGSTFLTYAIQEPLSGDALDPATTATKTAGGWALDGVKAAVPWGLLADRILVTARTGPDSIGLFLLDPAAPGVDLQRADATHREPQGWLTLTGATVADADVIGDPLAGTDAARALYRNVLAGMCATGTGVLHEAVAITARYISEREQFGKPLATFQGATLKAADAYIDAQATDVATWAAIWRLSAGRPADESLAIAKFWVADGGQRAVHICQHLHGGMGVDIDYPIHRYFLWAKELELTLGGATEQLLSLGRSLAAV